VLAAAVAGAPLAPAAGAVGHNEWWLTWSVLDLATAARTLALPGRHPPRARFAQASDLGLGKEVIVPEGIAAR
jgi:hypothetical protein